MQSVATQRIVALVDMDCFYCQVEAKLNPSLKGKPMAVVQYNQWKGGGIIAVNYEARDRGVTRHMRGDEAKEICPEISLVSVPTLRGKADLSNYRDAGDEVAKIFLEFSDCVQRASIDEAYLDLTKAVQECIKNEDISSDDLPNTFVVGYVDLKNKNEDKRKEGVVQWLQTIESEHTKDSPDYQLAVGAKIVEKMRAEIYNRTGFHCSAGIAHNKILAKLTAGLHKPKRQTVLPQDSVPELYETLPVYKVRNLGGKLGKQVSEKLSIKFMSELYNFSLAELQQKFDEKTSMWLHQIARGIDLDPVTSKLKPESIGCCKNFTGKNALTQVSEVEHWVKELASEISDRLFKDLEKNKRRAKLLTVSFSQETSMTRCGALNSYETAKIAGVAMELLKKFNTASPNEDVWKPPLKYLGLAASKFSEEVPSIQKYFKNCESIKPSSYTQETTTSLFKETEESNELEAQPSCSKTKPSFFLKFLKDKDEKTNDIAKVEEKEDIFEDDEKETYISLTEVFPDVNQAEPEVIESLPEELQKKLKEKLKEVNGSWEDEVKKTEICKECKKEILASEMMIHMDYHAALNLYSELNKPAAVSSASPVKKNVKGTETVNKRKKKKVNTPTKKMKSLTAFFVPLPKE